VLNLLDTIDGTPGIRVLDAGCGRAYALFWLAGQHQDWQLLGLDIDTAIIEGNKQVASALDLSNLRFRVGNVWELEPDVSYDLVFSMDVLEHIEDDVEVLVAWQQALTAAGYLVLHLPLRHQMQRRVFPMFKQHMIPEHVRDEYVEEEIRTKLTLAGFEVQALSYGFGLWGELAFELNNLFWQFPILRNLVALGTFPLAILLGYLDSRHPSTQGNSLIILARTV
jgi:trans-aconitate methyltransferase